MGGEKKRNGCLPVIVIGLFLFIVVPSVAGKNSKTSTDSTSSQTANVQINTSDSSTNNGKVNTENLNKEINEQADNSSDEITKEVNQVVYDSGEIKITYTGYTAEKAFSSAKIKVK